MSRTDKDVPFRVLYPEGFPSFYEAMSAPLSGDSGFRKSRRIYKRNRSKALRRFNKSLCTVANVSANGAKFPYSGFKRTWDFE